MADHAPMGMAGSRNENAEPVAGARATVKCNCMCDYILVGGSYYTGRHGRHFQKKTISRKTPHLLAGKTPRNLGSFPGQHRRTTPSFREGLKRAVRDEFFTDGETRRILHLIGAVRARLACVPPARSPAMVVRFFGNLAGGA